MLHLGYLVICIASALARKTRMQEVPDVCLKMANKTNSTDFCRLNAEFEVEDYRCVEVDTVHCPHGRLVSQGSVCRHIPDDVIFTCLSGRWVKQDKNPHVSRREKRLAPDSPLPPPGGDIGSSDGGSASGGSGAGTESSAASRMAASGAGDQASPGVSKSGTGGGFPALGAGVGARLRVPPARAHGRPVPYRAVDTALPGGKLGVSKSGTGGGFPALAAGVGAGLVVPPARPDGRPDPYRAVGTALSGVHTGAALGQAFAGPGGAIVGSLAGLAIAGLLGAAAHSALSEQAVEFKTNHPPKIEGCPGNAIQVTAPEGKVTAIVSWPSLKAIDPEKKNVTLDRIYGPDRGSEFPEGRSAVAYKARDADKGTEHCWIQIDVKVIRCKPDLRYPKHGDMSCSNAVKNVYGSVCTFTCEEGYGLGGNSDIVKCQKDGTWSQSPPYCQPVSCGDPGSIPSGQLSCPDGHVFPKLCYVSCNPGYRQRQGFPFKRCTETGVWTPTQDCVDVEPPKLPDGCAANMRLNSGPLESPVAVTWDDPLVTDNSGLDVTLTSDVNKGSLLDASIHIIKLTATDLAGNSRSCNFVVSILGRECLPPVSPSNGRMTCTRGYLEGSECSVTCDAGYELHGNPSLTCLDKEQWSSDVPTCGAVECQNVPQVDHGTFECGSHFYPAVCVLVCDATYVREGPPSIRCQDNGNWSMASGTCTDKEPPMFPNGCSRNVEIFQSRQGQPSTAHWTPPDVTDNSEGHVTLQSSHVSGSEFPSGVTHVTYTATDSDGNARKCEFTVTVTTLTCRPLNQNYSSTNFLRYRCPEKNVFGAECTPFCTHGFPLQGAEKVTCEIEDDDTSPPLMSWTWAPDASRPECIETNCTALTPPQNGALSCYHSVFAKECLMSCQERWDVPSRTDGRFVCPNDQGIWTPPDVVNCIIRQRPGRVRMMSDLGYYTNTCDMSMEQLKQVFIQRIQNSALSGACTSTPSCRAENIKVTCGAVMGRRRRSVEGRRRYRRQARSHYARVTFEIVAEYDESGKQPEQAYQEVVKTRDAIYNVLITEADQGHFNIGSLTTDEWSVGYPLLGADCPPGTLFVDKGTTKRISCVGCGAGHYVAINTSQCQQCEVGSYTELDNATSCTPCPPGWSTVTAGSISSTDCQETCGAGHFSEDGFAPCLPCPPAHYQSRDRATTCYRCPASTWTSGGAAQLEQCVPADVILSNAIGITADVAGALSSLTMMAFVYLSDLGVANVTFTFEDSTRTSLFVHLFAESEVQPTLPRNSSTSVTVESEAKSWSQLVLTVDPSSGHTTISLNNNTIITQTRPISSSVSSTSVEILATKGEVMVSGLFAEETLQGLAGLAVKSCHGDNAANLLNWNPAPGLVHSQSVCDAVDECLSSPCSMQGVCFNQPGGYVCQCVDGWTGASCHVAPGACHQHQCQNGATCVPEGNNYTCLCHAEYSGDYCQLKKVHGGFSDWSSWGNCSATCEGQQQRQRRCNNPTPDNDGDNCTGRYTETQPCGPAHCPVNGQWSSWAEWSACGATCGGGNRTRQRSCNNPPPQFGGDPCGEDSEDNEACNTDECPVNGSWRNWSEWTPCSVTCGGGKRSRDRACDSPTPANGGEPCSGTTNETEACSEQKCPECSGLRRSATTFLLCDEETAPYLKTCNLTCAPGYATSKMLPQYFCGASTGYLWNDQKYHDSPVVLPVCSVAQTAKSVSLVQQLSMKSGCDVNQEAVRASVTRNIEELPCVSAGCQTTVSVVCIGQSPGVHSRNRRSAGNLRVVMKMNMDLGNSTDISENATEAVEEYARRLNLADQSVALLAHNDTDRLFSVEVDGDVIEPDVTSVTHNTSLQCLPGSVVVYVLCVPCVPGSMEVGGQCELCPVGQYQDESGSTSCKPCPAGLTWDLPGAADVSQCVLTIPAEETNGEIVTRDPDADSGPPPLLSCDSSKAATRLLITMLTTIMNKVNAVSAVVTDNQAQISSVRDYLRRLEDLDKASLEEDLTLPLNDMDAFRDLDSRLKYSPSLRNRLERQLTVVGGTSVEMVLRTMVDATMTASLKANVKRMLRAEGWRLAFTRSALFQVITRAAQQTRALDGVTEADIKEYLVVYLRDLHDIKGVPIWRIPDLPTDAPPHRTHGHTHV